MSRQPICPACRERVIFARTEAMKWQALNPEPDPAGNVHAYEVNGNWIARSVPPRTPAIPPDRLYMPHAATCTGEQPSPARPPSNRVPKREPRETLPGVTSLDEWRRAKNRRKASNL